MSQPQPAFVRRLGAGERQVLALHCTIAHSGAWGGVSAALGDRATLIAPDMLSHGRSPDWDGEGEFLTRIANLALHELTEPMDVVGHSFGAVVALHLALSRPELVRSAVLIEPVFLAVAGLDAPELLRQHEEESAPFRAAMETGDRALAARLFNRMWSSDHSPRWPDLSERTRAAMIRGIHVVPSTEGALFRDTGQMLRPERMARAAMPIHVLSGAQTHPIIPVIAEGLCRRLPRATHAQIAGAGHMLPITHPVETAAELRQF